MNENIKYVKGIKARFEMCKKDNGENRNVEKG